MNNKTLNLNVTDISLSKEYLILNIKKFFALFFLKFIKIIYKN